MKNEINKKSEQHPSP